MYITVYIYIYMYTHIQYMYTTYIYIYVYTMYAYVYMCMYVYVYIYIYIVCVLETTRTFVFWFPAKTPSNICLRLPSFVLVVEGFRRCRKRLFMVSVFRFVMVSVLPQHHLLLTDGSFKKKTTPGRFQDKLRTY